MTLCLFIFKIDSWRQDVVIFIVATTDVACSIKSMKQLFVRHSTSSKISLFLYRSLFYNTTCNRTSQRSTSKVTNKRQLLRSLFQKRRCYMSRTSRFIRWRDQSVKTMKIKQLSFIHRSRWESHVVILEKISNVRLVVFFDEFFVFARQTMSSSSCSKFWSCWRRKRSFWLLWDWCTIVW